MGGSSKIILGMLLGGMITVDMGGPINKAAYVLVQHQLLQVIMILWQPL